MGQTVFDSPSKYNVGELMNKLKNYPPETKIRVTIRMEGNETIRMEGNEELIFMPINEIYFDRDLNELDIDALWKDRI